MAERNFAFSFPFFPPATCDEDRSFGPQEIIEFPVVMLNTKTLETECVFHSYVRPERNPALTRFCTNLTGIEQKEVDLAPVFLQVLAQLKQFLFDHHFLGEQCEGRSFLFSTCGGSCCCCFFFFRVFRRLLSCVCDLLVAVFSDWDLKTMLPLQVCCLSAWLLCFLSENSFCFFFCIWKQCGVVHTAVPAWMSRWANVKKIYNEVTHNPPRIRVDMVEMLHGLHLPLLVRACPSVPLSPSSSLLLTVLLFVFAVVGERAGKASQWAGRCDEHCGHLRRADSSWRGLEDLPPHSPVNYTSIAACVSVGRVIMFVQL